MQDVELPNPYVPAGHTAHDDGELASELYTPAPQQIAYPFEE